MKSLDLPYIPIAEARGFTATQVKEPPELRTGRPKMGPPTKTNPLTSLQSGYQK